jgi:hypothetical protein
LERTAGAAEPDREGVAMNGNSMLPISDEEAKLLRAAGGYVADLLGDLPKDLVGLIVGDQVKAWRVERLTKLWEGVKKRLDAQGTGFLQDGT